MLKKLNRTTASQAMKYPVKVLQFGKGNFLRGFADWMIDIANEKTDFGGAIQIVQTNSTAEDTRFREQEGLYHLVIQGISRGKSFKNVRLISCVSAVINPFEDYQSYLRTGENPDLKFIISNTTEAGITFDAADDDPHKLPGSFPGKLTTLLHHRYKYFHADPAKAVTVFPCELIDKNGEELQKAVLEYIRHWSLGKDFENWITKHTLFCNTLVDRIVPGYPKDANAIWQETGFEDHLMVAAEPFHLWLIEAPFGDTSRRDNLRVAFPLEQSGLNVRLVEDLAPYRTRKVRILNGAHTAMVPVAYLRGLRTVKEAIDDSFTGKFIRRSIADEIIPTLDLPRVELEEFASDVMERFQNPSIRHQLKSIALNSISKFQVRVLPSILEYHKRYGKLADNLLYSLAALILFYKGEWRDTATPVNDTPEVVAFFKNAWQEGDISLTTERVLGNQHFWKTDLRKIDGLTSVVERHMREIATNVP